MTVGQLKEELSKYPDHLYVFMDERKTEFRYGIVNTVSSNEIAFSEEEESEVLSTDEVVILSEE